MDETELRLKSCKWLKERYQGFPFRIPIMVFHDEHKTVTSFILERFKGDLLISIPRYDRLHIQPDIIGLIVLPDNKNLGWIIAECKIGVVSMSDLRQALYYAQVAKAYEAYLFYDGELTRDATQVLRQGNNKFTAMNIRGKEVEKRLIFVKYLHGTFRIKQ